MKERYQYKVLLSLIDHANIGGEMNNMHWRVLQTPAGAPTLLNSDRPILRTRNRKEPQGHIALPMGPRLLFIASPDADFLKQILQTDRVGLAKEVNRQVVEGATRFVYGVDDKQLRFVQNRFGKTPQPRLMVSLIESEKVIKDYLVGGLGGCEQSPQETASGTRRISLGRACGGSRHFEPVRMGMQMSDAHRRRTRSLTYFFHNIYLPNLKRTYEDRKSSDADRTMSSPNACLSCRIRLSDVY